MLIPFSGAQKSLPHNRTYNFYLSQLQIRIEMAFGRLTTKWRIFRSNLNYSVEKNSQICRVAARLHNYVIVNDNLNFQGSNELTEFGVELLEDGPSNNNGFLPIVSNDSNRATRGTGTSCNRQDHIVSEIESMDLQRPMHNVIRNREQDN